MPRKRKPKQTEEAWEPTGVRIGDEIIPIEEARKHPVLAAIFGPLLFPMPDTHLDNRQDGPSTWNG
jgi:hypothetical protein